MKRENLKRANEIEKELNILEEKRDYIADAESVYFHNQKMFGHASFLLNHDSTEYFAEDFRMNSINFFNQQIDELTQELETL